MAHSVDEYCTFVDSRHKEQVAPPDS